MAKRSVRHQTERLVLLALEDRTTPGLLSLGHLPAAVLDNPYVAAKLAALSQAPVAATPTTVGADGIKSDKGPAAQTPANGDDGTHNNGNSAAALESAPGQSEKPGRRRDGDTSTSEPAQTPVTPSTSPKITQYRPPIASSPVPVQPTETPTTQPVTVPPDTGSGFAGGPAAPTPTGTDSPTIEEPTTSAPVAVAKPTHATETQSAPIASAPVAEGPVGPVETTPTAEVAHAAPAPAAAVAASFVPIAVTTLAPSGAIMAVLTQATPTPTPARVAPEPGASTTIAPRTIESTFTPIVVAEELPPVVTDVAVIDAAPTAGTPPANPNAVAAIPLMEAPRALAQLVPAAVQSLEQSVQKFLAQLDRMGAPALTSPAGPSRLLAWLGLGAVLGAVGGWYALRRRRAAHASPALVRLTDGSWSWWPDSHTPSTAEG